MTTQEKLRVKRNKETAITILNQLTQTSNGINRLSCMLGAYNFCSGDNYVSFRFKTKNSLSANYCKITLNSLDLYNVELGRIHGMKYTVKLESNAMGLYNDQLKEWFENNTKLFLSL